MAVAASDFCTIIKEKFYCQNPQCRKEIKSVNKKYCSKLCYRMGKFLDYWNKYPDGVMPK